jgi:hypothetical protein
VYLDDIIIYSNSLEDHIKHCKIVIDILRREKLYLSKDKLKFLSREMKVLGRIIDDHGIRMDPDKVDKVINWKVPTNRDLLRGFLGAVGYLADDIARVRIPMGVLHGLTGDTVSYRWGPTEQRAFDQVRKHVHEWHDHSRKPLNYSKEAPPIWLITDGCSTGVSGVVAQGHDWKSATIAAFYSAKLNSAQQNYPVHEIEMLAGVESMGRHRDILQGAKFTWLTDHKGLEHLLKQPNLSGRQARWMEKLGDFDFETKYVPGVENVLADVLSRLYSDDAAGTVRSRGEYTFHDVNNDFIENLPLTMPLQVYPGAFMGMHTSNISPKYNVDTKLHVEVGAVLRPTRNRTIPSRVPQLVNKAKTGDITLPDAKNKRGGKDIKTPAIKKPTKSIETTEKVDSVPEQVDVIAKRTRKKKTPPPAPGSGAETGRPETSAEFAKRIKRVRLIVKPQEGGSVPESSDTNNPTEINESTSEMYTLDDRETIEDMVRRKDEIPPEFPHSDSVIDQCIGRYSEDSFYEAILERPTDYRNFEVQRLDKGELIYLKERDKRVMCIPDIKVDNRKIRLNIIDNAHSLLAHLGYNKTLTYIRSHVWWKTMVQDTKSFCEMCETCSRIKPDNQRSYGLLRSMPQPLQPWEIIGMDFIGPLPLSNNRDGEFDSITLVVDHATAMVRLIASRVNYKAKQVAELIFSEIYKLHGLAKAIVSDRDVLFTSAFWTQLNKLLGINLRMSTAYHPETDGASERAIRTVTQMIRAMVDVNQSNWVSLLPLIEFAFNVSRAEATGYAPFYLNYGRMPRAPIWNLGNPTEYRGVFKWLRDRKTALMIAHDSMIAERVKQTRNANRKRRPSPFEAGDFAYVSTKEMTIPKGMARKFFPKYVGPYKIIKDYGNNSYMIELPDSLKQRGIHPTFHSSRLRIHRPNDDRLFPGRSDSQTLELDNPDGEWAIDRILSHVGAHEDAIFEIKWKTGDITWMPYQQMTADGAVSDYFEIIGIDSVLELSEGKGDMRTNDPQITLAGANFALFTVEGIYGNGTLNTSYNIKSQLNLVDSSSSPSSSFPSSHLQPINFYISNMSDNPPPLQYSNISPAPGGKTAMTTRDGTFTRLYTKGQMANIRKFDEEIYAAFVNGVPYTDPIPEWYKVAADAYNGDPAAPSTLAIVDDDGTITLDPYTHALHDTHLFGEPSLPHEEEEEDLFVNLPTGARALALGLLRSAAERQLRDERRLTRIIAERKARAEAKMSATTISDCHSMYRARAAAYIGVKV